MTSQGKIPWKKIQGVGVGGGYRKSRDLSTWKMLWNDPSDPCKPPFFLGGSFHGTSLTVHSVHMLGIVFHMSVYEDKCTKTKVGTWSIVLTWVYLSMNVSAFGTLWSPRWTTDDPIHEPSELWAFLKISLIARPIRGADCIRFNPCKIKMAII